MLATYSTAYSALLILPALKGPILQHVTTERNIGIEKNGTYSVVLSLFATFLKNGGPVAQPFPCLFEKMLPNNSQALSTCPFRTLLMACSHIIEKPKNKRSSQKRLIRIQAECT